MWVWLCMMCTGLCNTNTQRYFYIARAVSVCVGAICKVS